jgi:hypothetical protein
VNIIAETIACSDFGISGETRSIQETSEFGTLLYLTNRIVGGRQRCPYPNWGRGVLRPSSTTRRLLLYWLPPTIVPSMLLRRGFRASPNLLSLKRVPTGISGFWRTIPLTPILFAFPPHRGGPPGSRSAGFLTQGAGDLASWLGFSRTFGVGCHSYFPATP